MSGWILIMTLYTTIVTQEFKTQESCMTAAKLWLAQQREIVNKNAVCVPK